MLAGLTGGIGCGKSTAIKCFKELGWNVFDSDRFCSSLYADASSGISKEIKIRWGDAFIGPDGLPDKNKIAELVFNSSDERRWLNSLIHPLVMKKIISEAAKTENLMADVPLLFEVGWKDAFDRTIAVWAPDSIRLKRLSAKGIDERSARLREKAQIPYDMKLHLADFGIINSGSLEMLKRQCVKISKKLLGG